MIPSFIDPYSPATYKIFRYIVSAYLLIGCVNVIFFLYPTAFYSEYRVHVLLVLTILHLASFAVLLIIAEYTRQPVWAMWFLWVWFLWNIFWGLATLTDQINPYLTKLFMFSGVMGFAYIFILFKLHDNRMGAYFRMLAGSHLLVFSVKIIYQVSPGPSLEILFYIVELLPIAFLLLLVERTLRAAKQDELEDHFLEELNEPGA